MWGSNSSPYFIAYWYFDYLSESKLLSHYVRLDKAAETGVLATIYVYSWRLQRDVDTDDETSGTVIYGPSASNQASIRSLYISFELSNKRLRIIIFLLNNWSY